MWVKVSTHRAVGDEVGGSNPVASLKQRNSTRQQKAHRNGDGPGRVPPVAAVRSRAPQAPRPDERRRLAWSEASDVMSGLGQVRRGAVAQGIPF